LRIRVQLIVLSVLVLRCVTDSGERELSSDRLTIRTSPQGGVRRISLVLTHLTSLMSRSRLVRCSVLTVVALAGVGGVVVPAFAQAAAIPITPLLDCVATPPAGDTADAGTLTAYFGYQNTGPSFNLLVGDLNQVFPFGQQDQGQPVTFSPGSFPDAFDLQLEPPIISSVNWELNGTIVTASADSTPCIAGATGPASDLTSTSATLTGLINSRDQETSYYFNWGTSTAYGQSTATQSTSNTQPQLESESLTGLSPDTTYHYQLIADNSEVSTTGADGTFTTRSSPTVAGADDTPISPTIAGADGAPSPPTVAGADVALTQGQPVAARVGRPFAYKLSVTDHGPTTASGVKVIDALPSGLTLLSSHSSQGSCAKQANLTCTIGALANGASVTITVQVRPLSSASLTNTAFASADQPDPDVANNAAVTRLKPTLPRRTPARKRTPTRRHRPRTTRGLR
jgi:uncharacterized repeat protein (TIGR01451 family)